MYIQQERLSFQHSLVAETLVSVITKAVIILDDGEERLVAVKEGKAKKNLVLEPHDIIKELRLLSSLSHPAVRLHICLTRRRSWHVHACTDHPHSGP